MLHPRPFNLALLNTPYTPIALISPAGRLPFSRGINRRVRSICHVDKLLPCRAARERSTTGTYISKEIPNIMFYAVSIYALLNVVILLGVALTFGMVGVLITSGAMLTVLLLGVMALMIASEARTITASRKAFSRHSAQSLNRKR